MNELPDAALALKRWEELERACGRRRGDRERRFRRRAYERARDRALIALAMRTPSIPARPREQRAAGSRERFPGLRRRRRTAAAAAAGERAPAP